MPFYFLLATAVSGKDCTVLLYVEFSLAAFKMFSLFLSLNSMTMYLGKDTGFFFFPTWGLLSFFDL